MRPTVIVTTYKSARALRFCLSGLLEQTHRNFELIVAEDCIDHATRELLQDPTYAELQIRHLSQVDDGFRKCLLLNRAISVARQDYIIFLDGDCIPRNDFVESHLRLSKQGAFLSGNRIDLPQEIYQSLEPSPATTKQLFQLDFTRLPGHSRFKYRLRNSRSGIVNRIMDRLTYRWCVFSGSNASAWKSDLLRVNGFDESFLWSSDDRDIGARLKNAGVRSRYAKHSLVQLHLDHPHPYADQNAAQRNRRVFLDRLWQRDPTIAVQPGIDSAWQREDQPRMLEPEAVQGVALAKAG